MDPISHTQKIGQSQVSRINIEQWDDVDAKNAFINGVNRWATKTVQENDPGNMPAFMTTELGKTIFQFRSFMLAFYNKELLSKLHHRDWETFAGFMTAMLFGGLFYAGQTVVNSVGRPDQQEFLDKRLSWDSIAKAGFQRAGFASILPPVVDAAVGMAGIEPIFDYRTSGLRNGGKGITGAALGNPTFDLLDNLDTAVRGASAALTQGDASFSQQEWRAVTSLLVLQKRLCRPQRPCITWR